MSKNSKMNDKPPHPLYILIAAPLALICGIMSNFCKDKRDARKKVSNS